jgi:hydrogenase maturation factor
VTEPVREPACDERHCITCGDDGIPMTVLRVDAGRSLALCTTEDEQSASVEIALVEPVAPGDRLLVHAGTAIARVGA